ncbi:AsnC family transcriptional regulator [Nakamurella flava]|uniref:AsnC family transcriptional regulator n=1 Tax=Nakamurella flava TaxID=2576308 RepID=A0A4U6Q8X4_9ACTN|nr:AsnC family transcriptional regulator [Nakamurella flava]TKV56327.1 AsnC family transcriptional regulator [Nakamurella flava]
MSGASLSTSSTLDAMDAQIVRCVQIAPRAPFSAIGAVLGVAEQTVARRYRRLRRDGLLRVTMAVDPRAMGVTVWTVRVRCRPEGAVGIAQALARRDDVAWVTVYSAGWEVVFNLRALNEADASDLLTRMLPKAAPVLDVSSAAVLHTFVGGGAADWAGLRSVLTAEQEAAMGDTRPSREPGRDPGPLTDEDRALLPHLQIDGRAPVSTLARLTGQPAHRISRRLDALLASGVAYLDVDVARVLSGQQSVLLWLSVQPGRLAETGSALAAHPAVPFAAAITGPTNLVASVLTEDVTGIYGFVTGALAAMPGVTGYETAPALRQFKQAGSLVHGDRLVPAR